jgi:uncharacterized protein YbjT (DUF2867 family)/membrane protease YdiL (CAAX protease family)
VKIAIAGGTGFVGRHVVEVLRASGHGVLVIARHQGRTPLGAELIVCDIAREPVPTAVLRGCDVLVNLLGIKREQGRQTFEAVHVDATHRLLRACQEAAIRRVVHVSVVCSRPDPRSPYHDTKWRAEQAVRKSGRDFTILRPGVVYGRGDDMVTQLVRMIRFSPLFPIVGRGESVLQPVDVRDLAEAIAATLGQAHAVGATYDIVGPDRMTLRTVVETVAAGAALPLLVLPTPVFVHRLAARAMDTFMPEPLSTPSQLQMLVEGLYGDSQPAQRELGLVPRPFTPECVRALEGEIGSLFGFSLRLANGRSHAEWLSHRRQAFGPALALAALAVVIQLTLGHVVLNLWYRMAMSAVVLSGVALARVPVGWHELYRPTLRLAVQGLGAALVLYALGAAVARALATSPALAAQMHTVYGWKNAVPEPLAIPLLQVIILGEEIVWRSAVTLPFAARLGPCLGTLAAACAYGIAHVGLGLPVLVCAALGAGVFWSALVVKTRSAIPALVSHVAWDLAVLFWLPYVG